MKNLKDTYGRAPAEAQQIIEAMGGGAELARTIGVTSQAISYWKRKGIPLPWLRSLRATHKSLFPKPEKPKKAAPLPLGPHNGQPCRRCGHQCAVVGQQGENDAS